MARKQRLQFFFGRELNYQFIFHALNEEMELTVQLTTNNCNNDQHKMFLADAYPRKFPDNKNLI